MVTLEGKFVEIQGEAFGNNLNGSKGLCNKALKDTYEVLTFDGDTVLVSKSNVKQIEPEHRLDGFDVFWSARQDEEGLSADLTEKVANVLNSQGYCVVQTLKERSVRETAIEQAKARCEFAPVPENFKSGYLGVNCNSKVAWLDGESLQPPQLDPYDADFSKVGASLATLAPSFLNSHLSARSFAMVRVPLSKFEQNTFRSKSSKTDDLDEKLFDDYTDLIRRSKLLMMYVVDDFGELVLYPEDVKIQLSPNKLILLRGDMSYDYKPSSAQSMVMQCWLLGEPTIETYEQARDPVVLEQDCPDDRNRPQGPRLNIIATMLRTCGSVDGGLDVFKVMTSAACDCSLPHASMSRWDMNEMPYGSKGDGKCYTFHAAFKENEYVMNFDNNFFGLHSEEVFQTSQECRVYFETGYEALTRAGYSRKSLEGQEIGCYCGTNGSCGDIMGTLMSNIEGALTKPDGGKYQMFGVNTGVMMSRFSHFFGLTGQSIAADTACSASLVAIALADKDLKLTRSDTKNEALAGGVNVITTIMAFVFFCQIGALSEKGRSFTFDAHVDGYMRGEGCCQAVLRRCGEQTEEIDSMLSIGTVMSCLAGSDGKSASLTAPSGPAQQQIMRNSFTMAGITVDECPGNECHGTGTPLGDPIEMGSVKSIWKKSTTPVGITSRKTFFGHTEANAGIAGIAGVLTMLHSQMGIPNIHLREVSGLLDLQGFMTQFWTECTQIHCPNSFAGVNSFGIGGTNARADLWGRSGQGFEDAPKKRTRLENYYASSFRNTAHSTAMLVHGQDVFGLDAYPKESLYATDHLYVVGTWDGRKIPLEMEPKSEDVYEAVVQLGDIRCEQFHIMVGPEGLESKARAAEDSAEKVSSSQEPTLALEEEEEMLEPRGELRQDATDMMLEMLGPGIDESQTQSMPMRLVGETDLLYHFVSESNELPKLDSLPLCVGPGFVPAQPFANFKKLPSDTGEETDNESTDIEGPAPSSEEEATANIDESSSRVSKSELSDEGGYSARVREIDSDTLVSNIAIPNVIHMGATPWEDFMPTYTFMSSMVEELLSDQQAEFSKQVNMPLAFENTKKQVKMVSRDVTVVPNYAANQIRFMYPEAAAAQDTMQMFGPDTLRKGEGWLLDGKGSIETFYRITLSLSAEDRQISWVPLAEPPLNFLSVPFRHKYHVIGAFTRWRHRELTCISTPGSHDHTVSFTLDSEGKAEFKLLRDGDAQQLIYPAEPGLLRGPDAGPGIWYLTGWPGEHVKFEMQMLESVLIITITMKSGVQIWRS